MEWYDNIWIPKSLIVVFFEYNGDGVEVSALKIKSSKDDIQVTQLFDSLNDVVAHFGTSTAYCFHVTGSGVLTRYIKFEPNYQDKLIINGDQDDFYFTSYNDQDNVAVAFFRKDLLKQQLSIASDLKIHLLRITAGIIPMFSVLKSNQQISFDYTIKIKDEKIVQFEKSNPIKSKSLFENKMLSFNQLIAHSLLRSFKVKSAFLSFSSEKEYNFKISEYSQFNQFKFFGLSIMGAIFLALAVNYFYINHLNNEIAELETELMISNDNLSYLERLEQEKTRKQKLIVNAGVNSSKFLSFYLDKIGESVPKQVKLQKLELFPLTSKLKSKQKIEVNQTEIMISGTTQGNEVLDNWIEKVDRFDWISSIELMNYLKNPDSRSDFELKITLSE